MKKVYLAAMLTFGATFTFANTANDISSKEDTSLVTIINTSNIVASEEFDVFGNCNYVIRETTYWSDGSVTHQDHFFSKWASSEQSCRDMAQLHVNSLNAGLDAPW